ncbi:MAG: amino acid adenylation domain-containing protein [Bacteroidota bacterium]
MAYNIAYFSAEEMIRIQERLLCLMNDVLANPGQPICHLNILPSEEKQRLLKEWNNTEAIVREPFVHKLFEEQVRKTPDAAAVVFEGKKLTYSELNIKANQLAHRLIALGVKPDTIVAIALERSHEMIISLLAVLKAGGAYLPLDPDYPTDRLEFMIKDSEVKILITPSDILSRFYSGAEHALCIDKEDPVLSSLSPENPSCPVTANNLAYVIYTSGSTGKPKGVAVEHCGLINLAQAQIHAFSVTQKSRVMQFASFSFDASVSEIMMALCSGAALYIPNSEERMPGEALLSFMNESGITHITLPPAALAALPKEALLKLECLIIAGEACPPKLAAYWSEGRRFFNAYGPTESTVCATIAECDNIEVNSSLTIGRPIDNIRIYILDKYNQPVPIGISGELHIGGIGLARGYLNRPELTAEKFIASPFSSEPEARLYKTGDLVRYLPDGNIEFLGRIDNQVKIRGFRIELGEIESALTSHPGIKEAAVIAREDEACDKKLVAYVVSYDDETGSPDKSVVSSASVQQQTKSSSRPAAVELRKFLKTSLPNYMTPATFVFLDKLPLTPNCKVDRKALPEPEESMPTDNTAIPRNAIDEILAGLWSSVLNIRNIGINDNFFELGGHSLLATKLTSRMREALGIDIPVRWLFELPTIAMLSERIGQLDNNTEQSFQIPDYQITPETENITPDMLPLISVKQEEIDTIITNVDGGAKNVQDIYPLAPLQEGILFHHRIQGKKDAYLSYALLSFDNHKLSQDFIEALQSVIDRHDILRTSFLWEHLTEPVQVVWRKASLPVESLKLDPADGSVESQLVKYCGRRYSRIDITRPPLIRIVTAQDGERTLMVFLLHHLISDHTTLEVMFEEIKAMQNNQSQNLPQPVPFRNFVAQTKYGISTEEHKKFFSDMLHDIETPTAPFGLMNIKGDGTGTAEASLMLPDDLSRRMRLQTRRHGATPAALCHLAWALVLSRCSAQYDVVFGSVLFGRMQGGRGVERTPGMFINTLPVRITCDERSVSESLKQTQQLLLKLMRHEHTPLSLAQSCSSVPSPAPLFSALLNFRHTPEAYESREILDGMKVLQAQESTNYPFDISVDDTGNGFSLTAQTDASVDPERICGYMQRALESLTTALENDPNTRLCRMDILSHEEKHQILSEWNGTDAVLKETFIHKLFEEQVIKTPDAVALVFDDVTLTYSELNARSNKLAHKLIELGVRPDTLVAIALERSQEMIIALMAVLKAGGAYVPLDPDYPADRLEFMIQDSGVEILITQGSLSNWLSLEKTVTVLLLDKVQDNIALLSSSNPAVPVKPSNLAYVIYTSGSTGKPKGVAVEHRAISYHCDVIHQCYKLTADDRVFQFASFSFDASVEQILPALAFGATLVLPAHDMKSPEDINKCIHRHGVTVMDIPVALFSQWAECFKKDPVASLRLIILGGDVVAPDMLSLRSEWPKPGPDILNAYGPTEATVTATVYEIPDSFSGTSIPIGRPLPMRKVYILDKYNQPLPIGIPGELHIGGMGLARGYLNRPELTDEKFIRDPFSTTAGARLYKTGDLARYLPDGNIEFLGRIDNQVKIRGFRIELGEIESALTSHPCIKEAVVISREDESGDKKLVAYIVPSNDNGNIRNTEDFTPGIQQQVKPSSPLPAGELRTFLKSSLPDYMLPAAFVFMETLPLTPNGKINRRGLPEPEGSIPSDNADKPRNAVEEILIGLWSSVLHNNNISINDNFFELGGHSLLATKLTSQMRETLGIDVPVRWLFESPTVSQLSERISGMDNNQQSVQIPDNIITPGVERITPDMLPLITLSQADIDTIVNKAEVGIKNIQDIYPLAPLQEGILFHHRMQEKGDAYLSYSLLSFDSYERSQSFTAALQTVINRHDILRTSFMWEQLPEPVQVVWRKASLPAEIMNFDPADGPVAEQLLEYCSPEHTRMDISKAPLMRIVTAEDNGRTLMILLLHHLIADHTTLEVILEEIKTIQNKQTTDLPQPVPFRNFAALARFGISNEEHEKFFRDMLHDIETPTAPFGLMNIQGDGTQNAEARMKLPEDLSRRLRAQTRRYGATPAALCHMAWALVLSRCSAQEDVVFGSVLFGRMQGGRGVERALGMFINTLPVRITCDDRPVSATLRFTQQLLLSMMRHEHASLSIAQSCSSVPAPAPLFSALFNYRHSPGTDDDRNVLDGIEILRSEERTNYPFNISVDDLGNGFALTAQTDASVDPNRICTYMLNAIESLTAALQDHPLTPLCRMDILSDEEKHLLLKEWNSTKRPVQETCVHKLFEEQVRKTPDAASVIFENETLTYSELNSKANRLAHKLIALGVKPETIVAIALERSHEMIIALLAVLKAGGAYLPLDPDYPSERLEFMIKDSGTEILITNSDILPRLNTTVEHSLCLEKENSGLSGLSSENPDCHITANNLAYVIYTSGSTGKPKGAALEHGGLINLVQAQIRTFSVRQNSRVMQLASFSFDVSVSEIMMALCSGAALYIPNSEERMPGDTMLHFINGSGITHISLTPTALAALPQRYLPKLECLIVGGETCPPQLAAYWSQGRRFFNAYGPTEATVCATIAECADIDGISDLPIGKPIANTVIYLLDKYNQPVPVGIPGELHIGGIGLARGYLSQPELTADKFIKDPFSSNAKAKLYKTGDLARYLKDGNIEFLGRIDNQVKIRGFRIELGEIESALTSHSGIKEAVVIAREDEAGDEKLIAYIVPVSDKANTLDKTKISSPNAHQKPKRSSLPNAGELRMFLKSSLPDYMMPAAFVFIDKLPLTPNGKVDRKALPDPEKSSLDEYYTAPRDTVERQLVLIWESLLSVSPVGVDDNFFELGGHSLLAVRLAAEIEKSFGTPLPVMRIFESPTISRLAALLRKEEDAQKSSCLVRIHPQGSRPPIFFLPGIGGMVSYLYPLSKYLGPDIPFFAFQAKGLEGNEIPFKDIAAMAEHYISFLLEVQPHGPYFLAGHSFGGHVAFAMAQILLKRGEEIGLLAIADTCAPGSSVYNSESDLDLLQYLSYILQNKITVRQEEIDSLSSEEQLEYFARRLEEAKIFPEGKGTEQLHRLANVAGNNTRMQNSYCPESFIPLPITLIRASEPGSDQAPLQEETGEDLDWSRYSDQKVVIHYVPGNHLTMMSPPNVEKLAQILSRIIG